MDSRKRLRFALLILALPLLYRQVHALGQAPPGRNVLDLSDREQITFITSTMDEDFPEDRADRMTMLIINRSSLTIPLIEKRLEETLKSDHPSKKFIDVASEMIAYAGDQQSLLAISKLLKIDEKKFGPLVARTLDNALNWRNPFTLAYSALDMGDEDLALPTGT